MSRVALSGATGFVGRHTLTALAEAGHEVHAIARRRGSDTPGVTWHEADLLDGPDVLGEVRPEVLVHLAWYTEHGKFWTAMDNVRWVEASLALLRAFAASGGRRAVMAGTCAEYEWSRKIYTEVAPKRPTTLYGTAKHGLHVLASAIAAQAGFSLAWGRLFFLYGPQESPERFVPSLVLPMLRGEQAQMTAGTQLRDFLHVADAGAAFATLVDSPLTGAVNIASGEGIALCELAALIARHVGSPELLDVGAIPLREGEPSSIVADVQRLNRELGWLPRIALEDGLEGTVAWWREHLVA